MDKINLVDVSRQTGQDQTKKTGSKSQGASFQEILDKAAAQVGDSAPSEVPAQQVGHSGGSHTVGQVADITSLNQAQTEGLVRAGRTLDILDDYVAALGDGTKTLKDMAPLVSAMEQEVQGLARTMDRLDASDGLKGVLSDVAVTAMVESIKFNRGDYLPAEA